MVRVSTRTLLEVDIIYYMTDVTRPFGGGEQFILDQLKDVTVPIFLLVNKIDLVTAEAVGNYIQDFTSRMNFEEVIPLSAAQGDNMPLLLEKTFVNLPEGPLYYPEDDLTDQPVLFIVSELIREKALILTRDEVPHSLAVTVPVMEERENGLLYVEAVIYVERESQKGIIIGKQGAMLKAGGSAARAEIAGYKVPREFHVWPELPRTRYDKTDKKAIAARLAAPEPVEPTETTG